MSLEPKKNNTKQPAARTGALTQALAASDAGYYSFRLPEESDVAGTFVQALIAAGARTISFHKTRENTVTGTFAQALSATDAAAVVQNYLSAPCGRGLQDWIRNGCALAYGVVLRASSLVVRLS